MVPLKIRQQILEHLASGNKDSGLPLAQALIQLFPQYAFNGIAYRSIMSFDPISEIKLNCGESFSADQKSISQFFSDNYFENYEDMNGVVVEAEIKGFNLFSFLKNELEKFPQINHEEITSYLSEYEIIALEIIKIIDEYEYKPS